MTPEEYMANMIRNGIYRLDDNGSVWRIKSKNTHGIYKDMPPCEIKPPDGMHYPANILANINGKNILRTVHRVVWVYHHGPIPEDRIIHHKDGNRQNNNINNLSCITRKEHQIIHASWYHERMRIPPSPSDPGPKRMKPAE
jgi:hypothetical protein